MEASHYSVELVKSAALNDIRFREWIISVGDKLYSTIGSEFNEWNFNLVDFMDENLFWVCKRDGKPVGYMMARLLTNTFDNNTIMLVQESLYAEQGTRAAKLLLDVFIDFGKTNANHVITMISESSNIKERSLERLGFKKLETLYRLET